MAGAPVYSQLLGWAQVISGEATVEIIPEVPAGKVYLIHYACLYAAEFGPYLQLTLTINEVIPVAMLTVPWDPISLNPTVATDIRASINAGDGLFGWPINPGNGLFTIAVFGQILTGPPVSAFLAAAVAAPKRPAPEEVRRGRRRTSPVVPPATTPGPLGILT